MNLIIFIILFLLPTLAPASKFKDDPLAGGFVAMIMTIIVAVIGWVIIKLRKK